VELPRRRLVVAGREDTTVTAIDAAAQTLEALALDAIVRCGVHLAPIDDSRAGLHVELDTLAGQPVVAVVEDSPPDRPRVAGRAIDLDAVGEEPPGASSDLDVAGRHEGIRPDLLEAVRDDRDFTARELNGSLTVSSGEMRDGHGQDAREQQEEDRSLGPRH